MDLSLTLRVEASTPVLLGGYDTRLLHPTGLREGLRPTSLKGLMRWWARAAIAAAVFKKFGVYPTINGADEVASKIFGSAGRASKISVLTRPLEKNYVEDVTNLFKDVLNVRFLKIRDSLITVEAFKELDFDEKIEIPRVHAIKEGTKFEVELRSSAAKEEEFSLAACSLALGLTLDGVGKAASRGFGKFRIIESSSSSFEDLILDPSTDALKYLKSLINKSVEFATGLVDELCENRQIPFIESLDRLFLDQAGAPDYITALKRIGIVVTKLAHKIEPGARREEYLKLARRPGGEYQTWVLGLPRSQEPRLPRNFRRPDVMDILIEDFTKLIGHKYLNKLFNYANFEYPTGYYYFGKKKYAPKPRRRSPIRFSYQNGNIIVFYFEIFDFLILGDALKRIGVHGLKRKRGYPRLQSEDIDVLRVDELLKKEFNFIIDRLRNHAELLDDIVDWANEELKKSIIRRLRRNHSRGGGGRSGWGGVGRRRRRS